MPVNEQIVDSVTATNTKVLGDAPSQALSGLYQVAAAAMGRLVTDAAADAAAMAEVRRAATLQGVKGLIEIDPMEAMASKQLMTGNVVGELVTTLGSVIAAIQQNVKTAQTTPPTTAP